MTTNSYLEYFLTLLGWLVNNGLWDVLVSTGLFALPLAFKVVGIWLKVREEGEDEGNKGMLSLPRIENALYGAFFVMIACCVPLIQVSLSTLEFDKTRAKTCGTWTPKAPDESGYNNIISSMDGESAAAPVWWVLVHKLSKGVTQAAVASIPCRPDLRQLRFEVQRTFIENRALADELQDFTNDCYSLALYQWKRRDQGQTTDKAALSDLSWIGSSTFLKPIFLSRNHLALLRDDIRNGWFSSYNNDPTYGEMFCTELQLIAVWAEYCIRTLDMERESVFLFAIW